MRTLISSHERDGRECVEQHLQKLRVKREELENLKSDNSQFIQDNNVVEIIRGRKERMKGLETASLPENSVLPVPDIEGLRGACMQGNQLGDVYVD